MSWVCSVAVGRLLCNVLQGSGGLAQFSQGGLGGPPRPQKSVSEGPWGGLQEGNRTPTKVGERTEDHIPRLVTPEGVGGLLSIAVRIVLELRLQRVSPHKCAFKLTVESSVHVALHA